MFDLKLRNKLPTICDFFEQAIKSDRLANAFVFIGQNDQLKKEFSYELAKLMNCSDADVLTKGACGSCNNCLWLEQKNHPEIPIFLEPDLELSKRGVVLTKQTQTLLNKLQSKSAFYRIIIIPQAESQFLPAESANSLLKTLEEPNPRVIFILFASDSELVLPTIMSRCQQINFPANLETSQLENQNSITELISSPMNFQQASVWAEKYSKEFSQHEIITMLDGFVQALLESFVKEKNSNLLNKIELTEKTKLRVKSFCSIKHNLSEFLWKVSR